VTCNLIFGDLAGDQASAPILFAGEAASTTTTTAPPATTTTTPPATTTTAAPAAAAPATSSSGGSGALAATGPPSWLWGTLVAGGVMMSLGMAILVASVRGRRRRDPQGLWVTRH
jgi:hypothetical protein